MEKELRHRSVVPPPFFVARHSTEGPACVSWWQRRLPDDVREKNYRGNAVRLLELAKK
jgi:hypothetical protein